MRRLALTSPLLILLVLLGAPGRPAAAAAQTVSYAPGWNLVAGPAGAVLSGASGSLYTLQPGDSDYRVLPVSTPLNGGWGYWAYFPNGGSLAGGTDQTTYSVTLVPGQWAMLGDPSGTAGASISGADTVLTYTPGGGYAAASQLGAGQGAWVLASGTVSLSVAGAAAATPPSSQPSPQPASGSLSVSSSAFASGQPLPRMYTCEGQSVSPPLAWTGAPAATAAFALIVQDLDAPGGPFTHWVLYNLPPTSAALAEAQPAVAQLPNGASQGQNDFSAIGYGGPCPPAGPAHHYQFTVYALDSLLAPGGTVTAAQLLQAMQGHVLAQGQIVATYSSVCNILPCNSTVFGR